MSHTSSISCHTNLFILSQHHNNYSHLTYPTTSTPSPLQNYSPKPPPPDQLSPKATPTLHPPPTTQPPPHSPHPPSTSHPPTPSSTQKHATKLVAQPPSAPSNTQSQPCSSKPSPYSPIPLSPLDPPTAAHSDYSIYELANPDVTAQVSQLVYFQTVRRWSSTIRWLVLKYPLNSEA